MCWPVLFIFVSCCFIYSPAREAGQCLYCLTWKFLSRIMSPLRMAEFSTIVKFLGHCFVLLEYLLFHSSYTLKVFVLVANYWCLIKSTWMKVKRNSLEIIAYSSAIWPSSLVIERELFCLKTRCKTICKIDSRIIATTLVVYDRH